VFWVIRTRCCVKCLVQCVLLRDAAGRSADPHCAPRLPHWRAVDAGCIQLRGNWANTPLDHPVMQGIVYAPKTRERNGAVPRELTSSPPLNAYTSMQTGPGGTLRHRSQKSSTSSKTDMMRLKATRTRRTSLCRLLLHGGRPSARSDCFLSGYLQRRR
jgi:hypothetical protein